MYDINNELIDKISSINQILEEKCKDILWNNVQELRNFIKINIGEIVEMVKIGEQGLSVIQKLGE